MVKSAERVLDVLEMLSLEPEPGLRLTDIAERLDIPKSSATALMKTLEKRCYTMRSGDGRYVLHPILAGGGWIGGLHARLLSVARPAMAGLVEQTGETAFLGVLNPDLQVMLLHKVVSPNPVRYDTDDRPLRPAYCSSIGRVQLAYLSAARIEEYLANTQFIQFTPYTLASADKLRADLAIIRERGFAESIEAREIGASGVSAPIFGRKGELVAALNISAVTQRFLTGHDRMRAAVVATAREITQRLCATASQPGHEATPLSASATGRADESRALGLGNGAF